MKHLSVTLLKLSRKVQFQPRFSNAGKYDIRTQLIASIADVNIISKTLKMKFNPKFIVESTNLKS